MLEDLLKKCHNGEFPTNENSENIKTAVLSRIEKENHMKHFKIKPLIIAAAVTTTAAASFVTANAATDGGIVDGIARFVSRGPAMAEVSKEHVDATEDVVGHTVITYENGAKAYMPDSYLENPNSSAKPVAPIVPNVPDTASPAEKYGNAEGDYEGGFVHKYSNGERYAISNDVKDDSEFKKLGSDTPYKEEVYYYAFEFLDGTKRYFRKYPVELMGVNLMDYGIISYTEGGTGEFYTEVVDGGVICGWRSPDGVQFIEEQPDNESIVNREMPPEIYAELFKDSTASLEDLRGLFGNDNFPVDERYKVNLERVRASGEFTCAVDKGTIAESPVDGKVIAAGLYQDSLYQDSLVNAVTVRFGDGRTFTICHLEEISVKVGDNVTVGQKLGVCGTKGEADKPMFTLVFTDKNNKRLR